jgi:hypothetical protein
MSADVVATRRAEPYDAQCENASDLPVIAQTRNLAA